MSRISVALLVALVALSFTSCATDDAEYNSFYRDGWLWPRSMDKKRAPGEIEGSGVRAPVQDPERY
jgi:hypothetical protein